MHIAIPSISGSRELRNWRPTTNYEDSLATHFQRIREEVSCPSSILVMILNTLQGSENVVERDLITCLHKRETKYDPLSSCIVDFKSRATCVSIKNFQLVHSRPTDSTMGKDYEKYNSEYAFEDAGTMSVPPEHVILQMGKVGSDCFNVDFQYPLSMLQAFAICLSRFDTKQR